MPAEPVVWHKIHVQIRSLKEFLSTRTVTGTGRSTGARGIRGQFPL
jgi:hypothetical protein